MTKPPNVIDNHLGRMLRRRRRALEMSQTKLAEAVGVNFQTIQKYECGANRMSASRLFELASALQYPVAEFFAGIEAPR